MKVKKEIKTILVTGAAGFIGFHLCEALIKQGHHVIGLDNINDYYDVNLKYARLSKLGIKKEAATVFAEMAVSSVHGNHLQFIRLNLEDRVQLPELFKKFKFDMVCNLAAQAGVRYSLDNPNAYIDSNIMGFLNLLEATRHFPVKHLVYASSSSVYGLNKQQPFSTEDRVDEPISIYAATKKSNELMAHSYSYLFNIPTTGLRFFTVYGPWGRPDMAPMLFAKAMQENEAIKVFNNGDLERDFTYIDDIVSGIIKVLSHIPLKNNQGVKYKLFNIGNSKPIRLMNFISTLEKAFDKHVEKIMLPMQDGDVYSTYADVADLKKTTGYQPTTSLKEGIIIFADWYKKYYN